MPNRNPILVNDPTDSRLDAFRNVRVHKIRPDNTFVGESEIVLERMIASELVIDSVLITPAKVERVQERLREQLQGQQSFPQILVAAQGVVDQVVGYPLHRGVIAVGQRPPTLSVDQVIQGANTLLVLSGVGDPENVGSLFRHCAGFGCDGVILLNTNVDPFYRRIIRCSMGWTFSIPFAHCDSETELISALGDFTTISLSPKGSDLGITLAQLGSNQRIALLLGSEGPGLTEELMAATTLRCSIPLSPEVDSLNVATAGAIGLYEVSRLRR